MTVSEKDALRFWAKVDLHGPVMLGMDTPCWVWTGALTNGYGRFRIGDRKHLAHRLAFEIAHGPLAADLELHHECLNKACVRHVEALTRDEHAARHAGITHCRRAGHPYTPDNVYVAPSGHCICRACKRADQQTPEYRERHRAYNREYHRRRTAARKAAA